MPSEYFGDDVIVVGAGHGGSEAATAANVEARAEDGSDGRHLTRT